MPNSSVNNPKRWRDHAEEMRVFAEGMRDPGSKQAMSDVADAYDRLAERMEAAQTAPSASAYPLSLLQPS